MFRLSHLATHWVLTILMVAVLLAWPLHQMSHAAEPVQGASATAVIDLGADARDDTESGGGGKRVERSGCTWCTSLGHPMPCSGTPPEFRVHAQASPPPATLPQGLPVRHGELAAEPRGPPRA